MEKQYLSIGPGIYAGENGEKLKITAVNRDYTGVQKKPVYYLQELKNGKAHYISGLFPTKTPKIFSFDVKDELGIKKYFHIEINPEKIILKTAGNTPGKNKENQKDKRKPKKSAKPGALCLSGPVDSLNKGVKVI